MENISLNGPERHQRQPTFNELLIQEVQGHPELYDQQHRVCTDNGERNMIWEVIASRIDESVTGEFAKKRWLQMRDRYRKELKMALRNMVQPKWPYFKKLAWLDPYLKDTKNVSISSSNFFNNSLDFSTVDADSSMASDSFVDFSDFSLFSKNVNPNTLLENIMAASNVFAAAQQQTAKIRTSSSSSDNQQQFPTSMATVSIIAKANKMTSKASVSEFSPDSAIASTSEDGGEQNSMVVTLASTQPCHLPTALNLPKIFANFQQQNDTEVSNELSVNDGTNFDDQASIISTVISKINDCSNHEINGTDEDERALVVEEHRPTDFISSSPASVGGNNCTSVVDTDDILQVDQNEPRKLCDNRPSGSNSLPKEAEQSNFGDSNEIGSDSFGNLSTTPTLPTATLNFSELNSAVLRNAVAATAISNRPLNSKLLMNNGTSSGGKLNEETSRIRTRNPPYLVRRGGSVKVKNSAFSLISGVGGASSSSAASSSVSPAPQNALADAVCENVLRSIPNTLLHGSINASSSSEIVTNGVPDASNSSLFQAKHFKANKKALSRTNSNLNTQSNVAASQHLLNTFQALTNNGAYNNGMVNNISSMLGMNLNLANNGNTALNWLNNLQTLAAVAAQTVANPPTSGTVSSADCNYSSLLTPKSSSTTPVIDNNDVPLSSCSSSTRNGEEKNDPANIVNEMMEGNTWINDEDLLFARLIVVRLKKFGAKDRRIIRSKINEWIDKKEEEIEKAKDSMSS